MKRGPTPFSIDSGLLSIATEDVLDFPPHLRFLPMLLH
jgi:hypothetical protein